MEVMTRKRYHRKVGIFRKLFRFSLVCAILMMAAAIGLLSYAKVLGPPPTDVEVTRIVVGSDGSVIGNKHSGQDRIWKNLDQISRNIIDATLAIEDRKFYNHYGFDFLRIGAALITNLQQGTKAQGASTITQQYARNLYLTHEKTWERKWNEALYALRLEMNYSKDEILEGYLNTIYYGHGVYGIEAASQYYFQKSALDLTLSEASMLAGIPKGPLYYSPIRNYDRAKQRQGLILNAMVNEGKITREQADTAFLEDLTFHERETVTNPSIAPYFQQVVFNELIEKYKLDPQLIENGGLRIDTTLDPTMQKLAEKIIEEEMNKNEDLQVALVAIDPRNGDVKALVGGRDFSSSPFNRAVDAKRGSGSAIKPLVYLAALEEGMTAATPFISEETTFMKEGHEEYNVTNFNDQYPTGFITLAKALALSDNIHAVKTHYYIGFDKLVSIASRLGIESNFQHHGSSALGTDLVSVLELTNSYSAFANGGKKVQPRFITKVVDRKGNVIVEQEPMVEQVIAPELAYIMTDLMTGMFDLTLSDTHASVTGRDVLHFINRPVAGKSGTTEVDSWMIGYTPQLVTGVWIGYDKGRELDSSQGDTRHSKRIWARFTQEALRDHSKMPFYRPDHLIGVAINPDNGKLATEDCPVRRFAYFLEGTEPTEYCLEHIINKEVDLFEADIQDEWEELEKETLFNRFIKWFRSDSDEES